MSYLIVAALAFWWGYSVGSSAVRRSIGTLISSIKNIAR